MEKSDSDKPEKTPNRLSRRKSLQKLGMGSAIVTISGVWKKPVVETVVIPAHAQTTGVEEAY